MLAPCRASGCRQDLLKPEQGDLALRENAGGVFVEGAVEEQVHSATDCLELLHLGDRNRCELEPHVKLFGWLHDGHEGRMCGIIPSSRICCTWGIATGASWGPMRG